MVTLSLALLGAFAGAGVFAGLRVNLTPSYPLGLWRIEPLARDTAAGDRVFICPPPTPTFFAARERGYLGHGLCPGWFSPLIKTVVAVAGQHVFIDGHIAVDGVRLAHSSIRLVDAQDRALVPATNGLEIFRADPGRRRPRPRASARGSRSLMWSGRRRSSL